MPGYKNIWVKINAEEFYYLPMVNDITLLNFYYISLQKIKEVFSTLKKMALYPLAHAAKDLLGACKERSSQGMADFFFRRFKRDRGR
jgi:hypothetical protein